MSPLTLLVIVWAVLTAVLVLLLIYRGTLTMHEDDQLFLDEAENHMAREQEEIRAKLSRIQPYVNWVGAASGMLLLGMGAMVIYDALNRF